MRSPQSFPVFSILVSIVVTAALGAWALMNDYRLPGAGSFAVSVLLVRYVAHVAAAAERKRLN